MIRSLSISTHFLAFFSSLTRSYSSSSSSLLSSSYITFIFSLPFLSSLLASSFASFSSSFSPSLLLLQVQVWCWTDLIKCVTSSPFLPSPSIQSPSNPSSIPLHSPSSLYSNTISQNSSLHPVLHYFFLLSFSVPLYFLHSYLHILLFLLFLIFPIIPSFPSPNLPLHVPFVPSPSFCIRSLPLSISIYTFLLPNSIFELSFQYATISVR